MVLMTIAFDEKASAWTPNREVNIMFLRTTEKYVNEIVMRRGYIYLNQIFEQLGVKWDPDDENPCIRNDTSRLASVLFETFDMPNDRLLVHIHRCY